MKWFSVSMILFAGWGIGVPCDDEKIWWTSFFVIIFGVMVMAKKLRFDWEA